MMKLLMSGAVITALMALGTAGSIAAPTSTATVTAGPALSIDKQASLDDANNNGWADVGETIQYSFTVRNSGNVTLDSVSVVDDRVSGLVPSSVDAIFPAAALIFLPAIYTVTAEDVASGDIVNVATATGIAPGGATVESEPDTTSTPTAPQIPATGTNPVALIASTVLLVALGAGLIILSRRRRAP